MSKLAKSNINMTDEKRALLEVLLREGGIESSTTQRISRRKQSDPVPLSFAQQRLWFLDQLTPGSSFYNISQAIRLRGHLDIKTLEASLSEVVRRHEILRTSFPMVDGMPAQVIAPAQPVTMSIIDLRGKPEIEREAEALRLTNEEADGPFDLQHGPLLRATLLIMNEEYHIVLFTMHHIISDGGLCRYWCARWSRFMSRSHNPCLPRCPTCLSSTLTSRSGK